MDEDVVVYAVVAAAADEDGAGAADKDVAKDGGAAGAVVHINACGSCVVGAEVVEMVVLDLGAAFCPVAAYHIECTDIAGLEAGVMDVVVLDEVVVACE